MSRTNAGEVRVGAILDCRFGFLPKHFKINLYIVGLKAKLTISLVTDPDEIRKRKERKGIQQ